MREQNSDLLGAHSKGSGFNHGESFPGKSMGDHFRNTLASQLTPIILRPVYSNRPNKHSFALAQKRPLINFRAKSKNRVELPRTHILSHILSSQGLLHYRVVADFWYFTDFYRKPALTGKLQFVSFSGILFLRRYE